MACLTVLSATACNGDDIKPGLPNYEQIQAEEMTFGAWYGPKPTLQEFQQFKDCGFNLLFILGHLTGWIGEPEVEKALELCDTLGIKAFVDGTHEEEKMKTLVTKYKRYSSFQGFNYDEPVLYNNKINQAKGLIPLSPFVEEFAKNHPDVEFLVNLNPCSNLSFEWGTPPFTYDEYLDAVESCVNVHYKDTNVRKWLSCDDYPLYVDKSRRNPYYLKELWLCCLEHLAEDKRVSKLGLTSHFFIQSMPFGWDTDAQSRNRIPSYNDLRLQLYTVMAFGYDAVSFFCYAMPPTGVEFMEDQYALLDRDGNKTHIYDDTKKVIGEVKKFSNTYMQFNDGWQGVYPVLGSNNVAKNAYYYNAGFDSLQHRLSAVKGVQNVTATEDTLLGLLQDKDGRPGYVIVNYNDTTKNVTDSVEITLKNYDRALVFVDGEKRDVALVNGKLKLNLGVGEGVFVIPYLSE